MKTDNIKIIGFDADDTLWQNMIYFAEIEQNYAKLLSDFICEDELNKLLFSTEVRNMDIYGFGVKSFMLSMIETAIKISDYKVSPKAIEKMIDMGQHLLKRPVVLLDGVKETVENLSKKYRLIVATKGDLIDQQSKLDRSGLAQYFHHVEIMSDKNEASYLEMLKHLDIKPNRFLMIGNSLKSDILPVLKIGGHGIHIPFNITWQHEYVDPTLIKGLKNYIELSNITELTKIL
ncbi:MAG TPA: HAD family hydrolase [Melioribacteraceae bacterium]|nr:HAD family hydrolase [Melioribacteraceae bacterium]